MKVFMISLDKSLLDPRQCQGNTSERHKAYGALVGKLDILVLSPFPLKKEKILSPQTRVIASGQGKKFFSFWRGYWRARKLFKKNNYDLIVCQDPFFCGLLGWFLKKEFSSRLLVHLHGDFFQNKHWKKENKFSSLRLALAKFILSQAEAVRAVNPFIKEKLVRQGIQEEKIFCLPTPLNAKLFSAATPQDKEKAEEIKKKYAGQKIVFYVGRLVPEKNLFFLLRCFKETKKNFPAAVLLLAGDGPLRSALMAEVKKQELEESVYFLGSLLPKELLPYYLASEFLVLFSTNESFGKVILEAAFCQRPTIASATIGARFLIKHKKNGLLVPVNDLEKSVAAMTLLLKDKNLCLNLGKEAFLSAQKFISEDNLKQVVSLWKKICQSQ